MFYSPTHFAKQTRSMFSFLGFSMILCFSAYGVISCCYNSFASVLLSRRKESVLRHTLTGKCQEVFHPGNEKYITVYSQTNHPHQRVNVDTPPSAELGCHVCRVKQEKERVCVCVCGRKITVCWLLFILTMIFDIHSVSSLCWDLFFCSSLFCFIAPLILSCRVGANSKQVMKTLEGTIKEVMIKSSTLWVST